MDYPDGSSTQDSMMLLIMLSIFAGNLQFCYNLVSGRDFIRTLSIFDLDLIFVLWPSFFRSVMSMAVHQATQMEERVRLPPIWDLAWSAQ